jgi:hypothetical protein
MRSISTLSWWRRNAVVLRRGTPAEGDKPTKAIVTAGNFSLTWKPQAPGIHHGAFLLPADYEASDDCYPTDTTGKIDGEEGRVDGVIASEQQQVYILRDPLETAKAEASQTRSAVGATRAAAQAAQGGAEALRRVGRTSPSGLGDVARPIDLWVTDYITGVVNSKVALRSLSAHL